MQRRIALAALNPHGGEGGLLGRRKRKVAILIAAAVELGIDVTGPVYADSVFNRHGGEFDGVSALP